MLNPSNFMSVPKYLKRKKGGSQGCLKTGEINDLDSRRLSKSTVSMETVRASWEAQDRYHQPPGSQGYSIDQHWPCV